MYYVNVHTGVVQKSPGQTVVWPSSPWLSVVLRANKGYYAARKWVDSLLPQQQDDPTCTDLNASCQCRNTRNDSTFD